MVHWLPLLRLRSAAIVTGCLLGTLTAPGAPKKSSAPENLVPANMQPMTDDKGNQWSVNNYGFLQNTGSSFFNNILMLHIQGQQFYNYQPMMTSDGKEFVLTGQQPLMGLNVTRRIRLMEKEGIMRYVDLFENTGTAPVNATVEYRNNFSNQVKSILTDRGVANPGALTKGETGIVVTPKQSGPKSLVFILGGAQAKLRPTFSQRGQYEGNFSFPLSVAPGQSVALCYAVTQVAPPPDNDKSALSKLFKAVSPARFLKTLRREDLAALINFAGSAGGDPAALLAGNGLETLEVERGKSDVLAMGDKTRLLGSASAGQFAVATPWGRAEIPFERVAGLAGAARAGSGVRVFLRDGQVFSGDATVNDFRFAMPSGARVDLDLASLDRLVRRSQPDEGKWDADTAAMLVTHTGDQLALAAGDATFEATTSWGPIRFRLADVKWFGPAEDGIVGHQIEFKDGSRFFGFLSGPPLELPTRLFGPQQFAPTAVRGLVTAAALVKEKDDAPTAFTADQPAALLSGNQRLLGQIDSETLAVLTGTKVIHVPPSGIRLLRNAKDEVDGAEAEAPPFQIELWGGGSILGQLRDPVVALRVRDAVWRVPAADLIEFSNPAPRISDEMRLKLAAHIRDLGSEDWEKREAASQALAEFGFMARPLLDEALKTTADPEVRRRVEKLLDELE